METIWTKLAAPHAVIETSLQNSSQERNFLLQRPGGETGSFGSIAGAETALTREFDRHVFEIAALLRVSQRLYNYRVWVVERKGFEPKVRSFDWCVYRKLKSDYNGDEVRQGWRVNE